MPLNEHTRGKTEKAFGYNLEALNSHGVQVKQIPATEFGRPAAEPDVLLFLQGDSEELICQCDHKQLVRHKSVDYYTSGLITAHCALFFTLNPAPGVGQ